MRNRETERKNRKLREIPVVSYLCWLLAVAVLFTGVTFSRYTTQVSGDVSTSLSPFVASYTIENISSTDFNNADYSHTGSVSDARTARSVRFSVQNHTSSRVSGVPLRASIRLRIPAKLADQLALQVREVSFETGSVSRKAVTPQYVLGNFIYQVDASSGVYEYKLQSDKRVYRTADAVIDTARCKDYAAWSATDEEVSLRGAFAADGTGAIVATGAESGAVLTVSSALSTQEYSVGFRRGTDENGLEEQLFFDLRKEILYYTIDLTLPSLVFEAGTPAKRTFELFLMLTEHVSNDGIPFEENGTAGAPSYKALLTAPAAGTPCYTLDGAQVLGYRYNVDASTYHTADFSDPTGDSTVVRVEKRYGEAGGVYTGENVLTFSHVAPMDDESADFAHAVSFDVNGTQQTKFSDMGEVQDLFGVCSNWENLPDGDPDKYYISLRGVTDDPLKAAYGDAAEVYSLYEPLTRLYNSQLTVLFVQNGEAPAGGEVSA